MTSLKCPDSPVSITEIRVQGFRGDLELQGQPELFRIAGKVVRIIRRVLEAQMKAAEAGGDLLEDPGIPFPAVMGISLLGPKLMVAGLESQVREPALARQGAIERKVEILQTVGRGGQELIRQPVELVERRQRCLKGIGAVAFQYFEPILALIPV